MTDKELTAAAARAAGIELVWSSEPDLAPRIAVTYHIFNPLEDDGDALRLAVSLGLDIDVHRQEPTGGTAGVEVRGYVYRRMLVTEPAADNGASLQSATRRAIVRAAAKIGGLK